MITRKISECINIRINVGNYQHIELVKYAEEQIDYNNAAERIEKEDKLRDDLVANMIRSMKAIPEKLGKGIDQAIEVEEKIKKAIPEWMANGGVPNVANTAKKVEVVVSAEQKEAKDKSVEEKNSIEAKPVNNKQEKAPVKEEKKDNPFDDDDLFK